ncbi:ribonuclease H2 subunit A [Leptopilina heterotoma]|uniref:ribonuclease H2 subunit A n=1 Tax=Leptopilina heterotoma TaxID=63436 RepID=UPI001CA7E996|nr:ribonuclease H2 subunit A [Leptopilina heterotoma]
MDKENKENGISPTKKRKLSTGVDCIKEKGDLTQYFEKGDHSVNLLYQSEVPQICKDEPCLLGVDEAGRGPVLGPMVYGVAYAPLSKKQLLIDLGCADSKSLTEEKRDAIFDKICLKSEEMGWAVDAISPNYISNNMYRRTKTSLNEVSMCSAANLIKLAIQAGVNLAEVYVDTVGKPEKYQARLQQIFPDLKIVVEKKADSTFPIVSAASICAKVSRDHALRAWQFREAEFSSDYGSGYPNDPATKKWLTENIDQTFGFPMLVRFSWSTAETILESKALTVEWEEEEDDACPTNKKISNYFTRTPKKEKKKEKHNFFKTRFLSNAIDL